MARGDRRRLKADVDNAYTQVANLLLEALSAAAFTGAQLRLLLCLVRQTYGYSDGRRRERRRTPALFLFQNAEYSCIHSCPTFGALKPNETGEALTRHYFLEGTAHDLKKRYDEDFPA